MAGGKVRKEKPSRAAAAHQSQGGIPFHKSKGQHILKNPALVTCIVEKAGIKSTDTILEIGPGTGNLTKKLLEAGNKVVAVEIDPRMVLELKRRFEGTPLSSKLKILQKDVLKCELPHFDICVANIPYQISSKLTFKLLAHGSRFRCAVIMFQREFAMRLVAQPGDSLYSRLSVNVQFLARVNHLLKVARNNFRPPPKVDSSVVRIEPRKPPPINLREWDGLLLICFSRKNKTLGSIFRQKGVLSTLEKNYKTVQAVKSSQGNSEGNVETDMDISELKKSFEDLAMDIDDNGEDDEEMDLEGDASSARSAFKELVESVLKEKDYGSKRSSKLRQEDFLHLLCLFNKAGIHFA